MNSATLPAATRPGAVHLKVADLERTGAFYSGPIGLLERSRSADEIRVGTATEDLFVLHARPGARRVRGTTGLFHAAIRVPERRDLALALRRLLDSGTRVEGFADHDVSEAIYLADPEGNGIEIYRDRPPTTWVREAGGLRMGTHPLDVEGLLAEARGEPASSAPAGTTIGHVHLHVRELAEAEAFWSGTFGFDVTARYPAQASFLSAGGYHHHLGANVWAGVGAPAAPEDARGLLFFEWVVPEGEAAGLRERLSSFARGNARFADPSGNRFEVVEKPSLRLPQSSPQSGE